MNFSCFFLSHTVYRECHSSVPFLSLRLLHAQETLSLVDISKRRKKRLANISSYSSFSSVLKITTTDKKTHLSLFTYLLGILYSPFFIHYGTYCIEEYHFRVIRFCSKFTFFRAFFSFQLVCIFFLWIMDFSSFIVTYRIIQPGSPDI